MNGTPKRESPLSCGEGQQSHLRGRDICVESKGARCWPGDSRWTDQAGGQGRLRQRECLGHAVGPAQLSHPNPRAGQRGVAESMNPQGFCRTSHGTPDEQPATAVPLSTGPAVFTARPFSPGPDCTPRQTPGSTAGSRGVPGPDPAAPLLPVTALCRSHSGWAIFRWQGARAIIPARPNRQASLFQT